MLDYGELIFVGEITLDENNHDLYIKVTEVFKGELEVGQEIHGLNLMYCTPFVSTSGKWLLYGHLENGNFRMYECGLSRSFIKPYENSTFFPIPDPPPQNESEDEKMKREAEFLTEEQRALRDSFEILKSELKTLREIK